MTPGEFTLSMVVLALMFLGAWKLGEHVVDWAHRFGQWRRDRARTSLNRLALPGTRVVKFCEPWRRRQSIPRIGGGS